MYPAKSQSSLEVCPHWVVFARYAFKGLPPCPQCSFYSGTDDWSDSESGCISLQRGAEVKMSLHIPAVSPDPSFLTYKVWKQMRTQNKILLSSSDSLGSMFNPLYSVTTLNGYFDKQWRPSENPVYLIQNCVWHPFHVFTCFFLSYFPIFTVNV